MAGLSWSLVVATLDREECLLRSLRSNVEQSRPPKQVIVVDASATWDHTHDRVLAELVPRWPAIDWHYISSARRSLPYQRNRGLDLCTSDVVFYLDDDAFMYHDCAERIMRVYENDPDGIIGGVSAALASAAEGSLAPAAAEEVPSRLRQLISALWDQERLFLPYDGRYYPPQLPASLAGLEPLTLFHGCRMTFRTRAVRAVGGSDEVLLRTAFGEDCDLSYRVSRTNALVMETTALLFHEQTQVARPKHRLNTTLILLNAIALYCLHAPASRKRTGRVLQFLSKRLALEAIRDGMRARWAAPCARGVLRALRHAPALFRLDPEQLRREYEELQTRLCDAG